MKEEGACFEQVYLLPETRDVWNGNHLVQRGAVLPTFYGFGGPRGVSREEILTGAYGQEMVTRLMLQDEIDCLGNDLGFDDVDVDDDDFGYDFSNQGRHDWASSAPAVAGGARA